MGHLDRDPRPVVPFAGIIDQAGKTLRELNPNLILRRIVVPDEHVSSYVAWSSVISTDETLIIFNNERPNDPGFCRVGVAVKLEEGSKTFNERARQILETGSRIRYEALPERVGRLARDAQQYTYVRH
jgi:hypothetical protein